MWNEVEKVKDPLKWWNDNCHVYPTLYHMALDYLSIPGKSLFVSFFIVLAKTMQQHPQK